MSDIFIKKVDVRAVNVPLEYPVYTAIGVVDTSPLVLIDIHTDANVVGRSYIFAYSPVVLSALKTLTESLSGLILESRLEPVAINQMLENKFKLLGYTGLMRMAGSGIDMALWDAFSKSANLPLYKLLGGSKKEIKSYDSHSMDGIELAAMRAENAASQGFKGVKTKIGYSHVNEDIAVIRRIREAAGENIKIMVDYNQGLSVPEAINRINALDSEGVYWVEEPVSYFDDEACRQVKERVNIPVQVGENWLGTEDMIKTLRLGANDFAMPDIMKIGGVTGWIKAAALAEAYAKPMSSHLFQEFSAHLLTVTETAHWLERLDIAKSVVDSSLKFCDGRAVLSDEPGAGFEWKESEIEKFII
jgi:mandelate racemase